jgi:hypothetical protein
MTETPRWCRVNKGLDVVRAHGAHRDHMACPVCRKNALRSKMNITRRRVIGQHGKDHVTALGKRAGGRGDGECDLFCQRAGPGFGSVPDREVKSGPREVARHRHANPAEACKAGLHQATCPGVMPEIA